MGIDYQEVNLMDEETERTEGLLRTIELIEEFKKKLTNITSMLLGLFIAMAVIILVQFTMLIWLLLK